MLEVITSVLALMLLAQFLRTGWYSWMQLIASEERAQTYLRTPLAWPYGFMMMGWCLFSLGVIAHLIRSTQKLGRGPGSMERNEGA